MRRPEVGILALAMLALACAVPTESPNWDMTWNVPVPDKGKMSIAVTSVLPDGVDTIGAPTATAFSASLGNPPSISRSLGADCTACVALNGQTAPKPPFSAAPPPTTVNLDAASSLVSATLTTGSKIDISITNGFNFDPIRPQAGSSTTNTGSISITVNNGPTTTLGTLTILGTANAIPGNGTVSTFSIPLAGTITGSQPIAVTMTMNSPTGSNVTINTNQVFSISATPTINISSATVNIAAQAIPPDTTEMDLSEVDSTITQRIQNDAQERGKMFLTFTNPFTIGGNVTLQFQSPPGTPTNQAITPITKSLTLTPAANASTPKVSTESISFTGQELRRIMGKELEAVIGGNMSAGSVTVTPSLKIVVKSRLQLNFTIQEQNQ